jgi:hypothetical protein
MMMQMEVREFSVLAQNFSLFFSLSLFLVRVYLPALRAAKRERRGRERERRRGRAFDEIYMNNVVRCVYYV